MPVISAAVVRPTCSPIETMASASSIAESTSFIKAPEPHLTSSKMQSEPEAIFLLMMLDAIRGTESTVAVTSRSA